MVSAKAPLPLPSKSSNPTIITSVVSLNKPIEVFTIEGIDCIGTNNRFSVANSSSSAPSLA